MLLATSIKNPNWNWQEAILLCHIKESPQVGPISDLVDSANLKYFHGVSFFLSLGSVILMLAARWLLHPHRSYCNKTTSRGSCETVSSSGFQKGGNCFLKSPGRLPSCLLGQDWDICPSQSEALERGIVTFIPGSGVSFPWGTQLCVCVCVCVCVCGERKKGRDRRQGERKGSSQ